MAIKTGGLVGRPFTLNGNAFVKCDGCGANFPAGSDHVSFSADCDEVREERRYSRAH